MDSEQRLITPAWVRVFELLPHIDVNYDDELVRGNRENQTIDKAAGAALFILQCLSKLAQETGHLDDVPEHVRVAGGLPPISEKEGVCLWARHHGNYDAFTEAVEITKQIVKGADTAAAILDRLAAFIREVLDQMISMFLENREKMKKEGVKS